MTGLRASHAHKPAHASAYFRAAEPVPSLLFPLSDISGLICAFARGKGLFRGVFRLWRFFFIFFSRLMDTNFWLEVARCLYMQEEEVESLPLAKARCLNLLLLHIVTARRNGR